MGPSSAAVEVHDANNRDALGDVLPKADLSDVTLERAHSQGPLPATEDRLVGRPRVHLLASAFVFDGDLCDLRAFAFGEEYVDRKLRDGLSRDPDVGADALRGPVELEALGVGEDLVAGGKWPSAQVVRGLCDRRADRRMVFRSMVKILPLVALAVLLLTAIWLRRPSGGDVEGRSARTGEPSDALTLSEGPLTESDELVGPEQPSGVRTVESAADPSVSSDAETLPHLGTILIEVRLENGDPVVDYPFLVRPYREIGVGREIIEGTTDALGEARIEELEPGEARVWSPLGGSKRITVVAGEQVTAELILKNRVTVSGQVVDPSGEPVPHASVWLLGRWQNWYECMPATRCGPDGRFDLSVVPHRRALGASSEGFGPSDLVAIYRPREGPAELDVTLTLTSNGGSFAGRVLSPEGTPVPGARVAVGTSLPAERLQDGTAVPAWRARHELTHWSGRFEFVGLAAGVHPVHVLASGRPIISTEVTIEAGATTTTDLVFPPSCSVVGNVRDGTGEPIEDATIIALDEPFVDPFPSQGPTDRGVPFHRPVSKSASDGSFTISGLPPGAAHLYAAKGTSAWGDGEFIGATQISLEVEPSEPATWNPVLALGPRIHGRVVFSDGSPMKMVFVSAYPEGESTNARRTTHTDDEGSFSIAELENRSHTVFVQLWDPVKNGGPLERKEVWPSESELVLTANYTDVELERALVSVRLVDSAKRLKGRGAVHFAYERGAYLPSEKDGVWRTKVEPGRYFAKIVEGDDVLGVGDWFDVLPGQDIDVGEVHTSPACLLTVAVERPRDLVDARVTVRIEREDGRYRRYERLESGESEVTMNDAIEGPLRISVSARSAEEQTRVVRIAASSPVRESFTLVATETKR